MKYRSILATVAGILAISVSTAFAVPVSPLMQAEDSSFHQIQYRRSNAWIVDGAVVAQSPGYYAYGSAYPSATYQGRGYDRTLPINPDTPAPGSAASCVGESTSDSAFPRWMCR